MAIDPDVLSDFIELHGPSYKQNSVSYIFDCPRCSKRDKLYIRKRDGKYVCWYCREISKFFGNAEYALSEICGLPLVLVKEALYGADAQNHDYAALDLKFGDFFGEEDEVSLDIGLDEIPALKWPLDFFPMDHKFAAEGRSYLEGRGIPLEVAMGYDLRYHPREHRVMFPIEAAGKLVGWQGRITRPEKWWDEENAKYVKTEKILSSRGIPRDRVLMFGDRTITGDYVVLTEGPMDALKCHLAGGNAATMGKAVSPGQVALLRKKGIRRVYLALDPDAVAETSRLVQIFADLEVYSMMAPAPFKDIGEMSMAAVAELFGQARRLNVGTFLGFFRR